MEPIPRPMAGKNARNVLTKAAWRKVRDIVLEEHDWACAVCHRFKRKGLHCHEKWDFKWLVRDSKNVPVMKLVGLQALCRLCHGAKHIGCSRQKKYLHKVKEHLRTDYGLDDEDLDRIESEFEKKAEKLSTKIPRELDLTYLNHEKFDEVHLMMNRMFSTNELGNCRPTSFDS
jgi:hypothetical protein